MLPRLAGRLHRHALLLAVVGIAGCADPLSPRDVAGVYALRTSPPAVMDGGDVLRVLAYTLVLRADGTGERRSSIERTLADSPVPVVEVLVDDLTYRIEGRSIGVETLCAGVCTLELKPPQWFEWRGRTLRPWASRRIVLERIADPPAP